MNAQKKLSVVFGLLLVTGLVLAACQPQVVEVVKEVVVTQVVHEEVEVPVEVEKIVEVEVEKVVEVEVEKVVEVEVEKVVEVEVPVEVQQVRVNMGYIPDVQFAPFYAGIEQGFFLDEGIAIVTDFSTEEDGYVLVGAGTIPFAIGAGDSLMQARSQGLPIVLVARWYNGIPSAIVSLADSGIETPADLVGKTLGMPGFYGILYKSTLAMLDANELTTDDVQMESIGWTQIAAVSEGLVDAAVVYANNEPTQMMWEGMDINVMELTSAGNFVPIGVHTSEDIIANNPELVEGFVRAFLKSVKFCVDNPDEALDASMRAVGVYGWERSKAEMALAASLKLWEPVDGIYGYYEEDPFIWSQDFLLSIGEMDESVDVTEAFTNDFVDAVGQP
jgi:NitT/TauT family transport system substrate-binding protein